MSHLGAHLLALNEAYLASVSAPYGARSVGEALDLVVPLFGMPRGFSLCPTPDDPEPWDI
jgi:hypothetical protein